MDTYTIYRIRDNETHETYIGSTMRTLEYRINQHKLNKKKCNSWKIIKNNNYVYSALLQLKCNKETALWLERFAMENHYNIVNYRNSITTEEEKKEYMREWNKNNKQLIHNHNKKYYKNNKERLREYNKKRRALKQETYICECGQKLKITSSRERQIKKHQEGIRHINRIKKNELKDKRL